MVNLVTILNSAVANFRRKLELKRMGKSDIRTAKEAAPFGTDAVPLDGFQAVYSETSTRGEKVIIGYINRNQLAQKGEHRIYSVDADGNIAFFVYLKKDGTLEMNGSADNLVRFSKLKESVDELKDDLTTLKQVFSNWVVVANDGGAALKTGAATWYGTPLQKNIDDAKINEIKIP